MDLIHWVMKRPVTVAVGVFLVIMAGLVSLTTIPIQLTPTIDRPTITVETAWPGRSPQEVVDEITKEQEERLKNVANLKSMRSSTVEGLATITLEFYIGTSTDRAMQEVSDALRQVPEYPVEVDEPIIRAADGSGAENAIAWIIIDLDPAARAEFPEYDVSTLYDAMEREVEPYLRRIGGVAQVNIYGGRERQVQVLADPRALAERGLSHTQVIDALRRENRNVSAGSIAEGKRDYRIRLVGQYTDTQQILDTIVAYRDGHPVFVRDVASVELDYDKARGFVRSFGEQCLAMNVIRRNGANVISVMDELKVRLEEVRTEVLPKLEPRVGAHLRMRQVYDETNYIHDAIGLLTSNLIAGSILSVLVLFIFLRSVTSTLIIALSIPISIIGTFLVMAMFGRTLNVVSLAGLAFATGVVVDSANVVLENIDRRRRLGDPPLDAIYRGTKEVWGAVLAGGLTTVVVFLPVLTIREEAGQIFFDISLALTVSVLLSLVVAVTVVPAACAVFQGQTRPKNKAGTRSGWWDRIGAALGRANARFAASIAWLMTGWRAWTLRPAAIAVFTLGSIVLARVLAPPMDYLPAGNQNLVFGGMLIPPGISVEQMTRYAERIEEKIKPYAEARLDDPASLAALAPIMRFDGSGRMFDPVPVRDFFIGAFNGGMFIGGISADPQRVIPVGNLLTTTMMGIPDTFGGAGQASIFAGIEGGNAIRMEVSGPNLEKVNAAAGMMFMTAMGMPGYGPMLVQPDPANFLLQQAEFRLRLNDRGRELGLRTGDLADAARGLFDGAFVGDFKLDGENVDLVVLPAGRRLAYKELLRDIPISTPAGPVVPIDSVVEFVPAGAAQSIQRIEELPSVTIQVKPPEGRPIETVMQELRENVIAPAEGAGLIDPTMRVRLEGTAAKLDEVKTALFGTSSGGAGLGPGWQRAVGAVCAVIMAAGVLVAARALVRAARRGSRGLFAGALGALLLAAAVAGGLMLLTLEPQLLMARFVWALLVTYLLMCALFESFVYPLVIMFSVPFGIVGGFAALRLVHDISLSTPERGPQNLDVLTMLGFVILIGTVVNNAILLVEQALNFMHPERLGEAFVGEKPLAPVEAIRESIRTRMRPIFMTTLTTVTGGLPLVVAPGSGSEMYRGLGAVVLGGLLGSTIFTLVLVPLVFSLTVEMVRGLRLALGLDMTPAPVSVGALAGAAPAMSPEP